MSPHLLAELLATKRWCLTAASPCYPFHAQGNMPGDVVWYTFMCPATC